MLKWVIIFFSSVQIFFPFESSMLKILSNFQKEWCTFGRKKDVWNKQRLSTFNVWMLWTCNFFIFVLRFEHVNFAINENIPKNNYDNLNYYVSVVTFQTYKNVVLRSDHSLGWLLWLWFYPTIAHYHVDTYNYHCWHTHHKWQNPP